MEGIIIFADDHVFHRERHENKFFTKFNSAGNFPIIPIDNLSTLEKTISAISTYRAIILDWNFKQLSDEEGVLIPDETPYNFLISNKIFSLIYIYSQVDVPKDEKEELERLYPNKIFFAIKESGKSIEDEYNKILTGIQTFESVNNHLKTPFTWSQSINNSVQTIFNELEAADPNWIKEIYHNAESDGGEPIIEVINVFQNLLLELIVQDDTLIKSIQSLVSSESSTIDSGLTLAKLYNRIYYTKLKEYSPLMTGDIFKITKNIYAILITPECDVAKKSDYMMEFLQIEKEAFYNFIQRDASYSRVNFEERKTKNKLDRIHEYYNQSLIRYHILPSFPFEHGVFNNTALIDFSEGLIQISKEEWEDSERIYKLNSPYIHQLKQRYLSYMGRVGVPALPKTLRNFNIS